MQLTQLSAQELYQAIISGCQRIIKQRGHINAINLFPVADGDTGDNMAATAMAIINHAEPKEDLEKTLQSIADASIYGARGNSGMIFSQFFNALCDEKSRMPTIDTQHFSKMLNRAARSVRETIQKPVDGTILTMIESWASYLSQSAKDILCFNHLFESIKPALKKTLTSTSEALSVLKEADVVDAGALGFYHFIRGFSESLANPKRHFVKSAMPLALDEQHHEMPLAGEPPCQRYCTEAMMETEHLDKGQISSIIREFGDCVVLTENEHLCRFHLHTNEPWKVFSKLSALGKIAAPKVDDMLRQYQALHERKTKIALVTDSGADLPQEIMDAYQIHVIPLNVHLDDHHLLDGYCVDPKSFYDNLKQLKQYPKTSSPSPVIVEDKLRHLSRTYDQVLVISIAKVLSSTCDSIIQVAQKYPNVHVIDSRATAAQQGLLVEYAARLIAENNPIDMIIEKVSQKTAKIPFYVVVSQFDSLIRSGRVNKMAGKIAEFSGLKPILTLNTEGKGVVHGKAFSEPKAMVKILKEIENRADAENCTVSSYCVVHAGAPEKALEFSKLAEAVLGKPPQYIKTVSAAIGLHAGQGCVGIACSLD